MILMPFLCQTVQRRHFIFFFHAACYAMPMLSGAFRHATFFAAAISSPHGMFAADAIDACCCYAAIRRRGDDAAALRHIRFTMMPRRRLLTLIRFFHDMLRRMFFTRRHHRHA